MADLSKHPFKGYYDKDYGFIYGRPFSFNRRCDPNDRVFQKTMLKNNTIVSFTPGLPKAREDQVDAMKQKIEEYNTYIQTLTTEKERLEASTNLNKELVESGIDARFLVFEHATAQFARTFQILLNRVATAIFGGSSIINTATQYIDQNASQNYRGFRVWMERSTAISESLDNSYGESALQKYSDHMSGLVREFQMVTGSVTGTGIGNFNKPEVSSEGLEGTTKTMADAAGVAAALSAATGGAKLEVPSVWQDSQFSRSYNLSFKFMSPYGDDKSIFTHVITPFIFLLTCAAPRQLGPSGIVFPYIFQVDAPGYFSCPMGAITSLSFTKGSDDHWFNPRGLPLMIEGTINISDLYQRISIPNTYGEFATNFGTSLFLANLGGLPMYNVIDRSITARAADLGRILTTKTTYPYTKLSEEYNNIARFLGITEADGLVNSTLNTVRNALGGGN